ncbi:MAG: monovalent cation/H+ antiporter complex subunit F [Verrucomicrobiota bacterium]
MLNLAIVLLAISLALSLARLATARLMADRIIALDVVSFQLLGIAVLLAFFDENPLALQFAFALSLLGFLATVLLSQLLRKS